MKKMFLSIAFFGLVAAVCAQPVLSFEKKIHDFGDIKEEGGAAVYSFNFTNTGTQPLVIHTVQASCGCTTPDWTRTPIQPGGKGFVKATFDPRNRPNNFNKTITVTSNAKQASEILRITGNVIPKPKTMEDIYPRKMGDAVRLKASHLSFTKIDPSANKTERLELINISDKPVTISFERVPAHLAIRMEPATIQPGATGAIVAEFDATKKKDWGFVNDQVFLVINGTQANENRISVSATIEEDYSKWDATQMANAPVIGFSENTKDFGDIKKGEKVSHTFKVTNSGKSNLILRKVNASCGCTATQPDKNVIAPNETANITVTFNSAGRNGRQNQSITVLSNDPKKSSMILRITSNVVE
ncbi:MAG: DUF1573 domain-containing protein [Cytophagaceae bacterium]|nr:DUF1573 domain-containing protein [Cytophagaceae bacterium]